ncbi:hypothetical protein VPH35_049548 [Triticum aestivum]
MSQKSYHQTHDDVIPLLEGAEPINLRSYRYSHNQKATIEKLVDEMLAAAMIRPSSSPLPFSSLVPVGRMGGSWRLYIDYRKLNSLTINKNIPFLSWMNSWKRAVPNEKSHLSIPRSK